MGGGTRIPDYTRGRHPNGQQMQIHVVLNGTLNFVFDEMRRGGRTLGEACEEAVKLGYAEPGANDPQNLINGELVDVHRKICVFFNMVLTQNEFLTPDQLGLFAQSTSEIQRLSEDGADCRLVISFSNYPSVTEYQSFGPSLKVKIDKWIIYGGFRKIVHLSTFDWLPSGVSNAIHIIEGQFGRGGKYTLTGPGAGAEPTTSAMLNDFNQLCPP